MNRKNKAPPAPTRAVCYVRISVDREDETSTETQEERIRAYCTAHGWDIVDVVVEPGRSAYKASRSTRPGFRRVMGLVSSGAADVLVVWKLDRAGRNTEDTLALVRELAGYGAQFASVTEQFDTSTATGRMMLTMLAALAEMESATKSERVQVWQDHRRSNGSTPTGPRPYGYRRERNELHIIEAEAAVIRQAAAKVLAGHSLRSVAGDLAVAGVVGKKGKPYGQRGLRSILIGPTIAAARETSPGVFVCSEGWEPVLDRDTWDKLRALLMDPARRTSPGNARKWLLSGIATCGRCPNETRMYAQGHVTGVRYSCPKCFLSIEQGRTDQAVEAGVLALLDARTWRRLRRGRPEMAVDFAVYQAAMQTLTDRFVAGDIDGDELKDLAENLRLQQEVRSTPPPPLPAVDDLRKAWPGLDIEQKRLVISAATESLVIRQWTPTGRFDQSRIQWVPVA